MTCEEFHSRLSQSPSACTRAERAATVCHYRTCKDCARAARARISHKIATMPRPEVILSLSRGLAVTCEDIRDPEYLAVACPQR